MCYLHLSNVHIPNKFKFSGIEFMLLLVSLNITANWTIKLKGTNINCVLSLEFVINLILLSYQHFLMFFILYL